jgi:hypothetical protein
MEKVVVNTGPGKTRRRRDAETKAHPPRNQVTKSCGLKEDQAIELFLLKELL